MIFTLYNSNLCTVTWSSFKLPKLLPIDMSFNFSLYSYITPIYDVQGILNNSILDRVFNLSGISYIRYNLFLYTPHNFIPSRGVPVNYALQLYNDFNHILHSRITLLSLMLMLYFLFYYLLPLLCSLLLTGSHYLLYMFKILINIISSNNIGYILKRNNVPTNYKQVIKEIVISSTGSVLYIILGTRVDLWFARSRIRFLRFTPLLKALVGGLYSSMILVGIISTNHIYFLYSRDLISNESNTSGGILIVVGNVLSIIFSAIWYLLGSTSCTYDNDPYRSLFRAICEYISFLGVVLSTYDEYNYWLMLDLDVRYIQLLSFLVGTLVYSIFICILVWLELYRHRNLLHYFAYGITYTLWWTGAVFSTNPVLYLLQTYDIPLVGLIVLAILCALITAALTPDLYPAHFRWYRSPVTYYVYGIYYPDRTSHIIPWRLIIVRGVRMYFLILTYVITGYIVQYFLSRI